MTKRILALMGVIMMLVLTCVPVYAGDCSAYEDVLEKMYGKTHPACDTDSSAFAGGGYAITVTKSDGTTQELYLESRPTINQATVTMNSKGQLNVYGMGTGDANTWNQLFAKYKNVIVGISGIGAITMMALFIIQFMKLGASAGNPQARSQALTGVLWTGIAAALLGAVSIIAGFFYNAI